MRVNLRHGTFLLLLVLVTLAFLGLVKPFFAATFWAAVLATIFHTLYERLCDRTGDRENLAASIMTVLILLVVLIPLVLLSFALVRQTLDLVQRIESGQLDPNAPLTYINRQLPLVESFLQGFGVEVEQLTESLTNFLVNAARTIADRALTYSQNILGFLVQFSLMLYLLFFFLRDGYAIMRAIVDALPLGNQREWTLFRRFATVSRATLRGTLIVAIIQGTIGGLLFWVLGIPAPLLWGVVMTFLSLLPVGGSGLVWGPAAAILALQGVWIKALILVIVGALIIGLIDNLLRPLLVGRDTKMPDYLVLVATLGGLAWFGLSGFILGPVVAALFLTCWEIAGREYGGRAA